MEYCKHQKGMIADIKAKHGVPEMAEYGMGNVGAKLGNQGVFQLLSKSGHVIQMNRGAFDVFGFKTPEEYEKDDEDFCSANPDTSNVIVVGVADTGICADSSYLSARLVSTITAIGTVQKIEQDSLPRYHDAIGNPHGTRVAAQAAYGTPNIKLVDIRLQLSQMGIYRKGTDSYNDNYMKMAQAMKTAIEDKVWPVRIITCSIDLDWGHPALKQLVRTHPQVVFLMSGGNNPKDEIKKRPIDDAEGSSQAHDYSNALLVGGVDMTGVPMENRGYGSGIDVTAPSGDTTSIRPMTTLLPSVLDRKLKIRAEDVITKKTIESLSENIQDMNRFLTKCNIDPVRPDDVNQAVKSIIKCLDTVSRRLQKDNTMKNVETIKRELEGYYNIIKDVVEILMEIQIPPELQSASTYSEKCIRLSSDNTTFTFFLNMFDFSELDPESSVTSTEDGVSFGIPVVANVAAKILIINPHLSGKEVAEIIKASYYAQEELDGFFPGEHEVSQYSTTVLNPRKAYDLANESLRRAEVPVEEMSDET